MSKEKQIEEMAKDLQKSEHWYFKDHSVDFELDRKKTAENLYNVGYRKQSKGEWLYDWNGECLEGTDAPLSYKCLVCNEYSTDPFAFCPNCGAKMKGEKQ